MPARPPVIHWPRGRGARASWRAFFGFAQNRLRPAPLLKNSGTLIMTNEARATTAADSPNIFIVDRYERRGQGRCARKSPPPACGRGLAAALTPLPVGRGRAARERGAGEGPLRNNNYRAPYSALSTLTPTLSRFAGEGAEKALIARRKPPRRRWARRASVQAWVIARPGPHRARQRGGALFADQELDHFARGLEAFAHQHFVERDLADLRPHVVLELVEGAPREVL